MWKQVWLSLFRFYPFEEEAVMLGCHHQGLRLLHPVSDPHPKGVALSLSGEVAVRAQLLDPRSRQEDGARCMSVIPSPWVWARRSDSFLMNRLQQRWCDVILEIRLQKDYGLSSLPPLSSSPPSLFHSYRSLLSLSSLFQGFPGAGRNECRVMRQPNGEAQVARNWSLSIAVWVSLEADSPVPVALWDNWSPRWRLDRTWVALN